ncbi:TonB family protein [Aurantiacibacter rhizosphaerae]|uniref:TonB family protein n=1 Tax=Aurantiacibacter rhizosphaerae TaxID=2691582 RepID=A0A844XDG9_9SPHN|nr:TonB family protein [Aurantiacibacter rhizosphaerae]MWV27732.1 TonB family protein [Aurantiacibacter rhizosphaerae]
MAYANATVSPTARLRAAAGVIAIHAVVGAGIIAGLAVTGVITEDDGGLVAYFNPDPPAPPPPPPEIVPEQAEQALAPITAPKPPIEFLRPAPVEAAPVNPNISDVVVLNPPRTLEIPGPEVIMPTPSPSFSAIAASPRNGPAGWITTNDYARSDLVRDREGTAGYRLVIGSDGKVDACEITRSSGHSTLDRNTCRLLERRARFDPAKNDRGETTVGTYTGSVTWQIPER